MENAKVCTKCGAEKPNGDFHKNLRRPGGLGSWCKPCCNRQGREARLANPEKNREYCRKTRAVRREVYLKTDLQRRVALKGEFLKAYGGRCTCCGESEPRFLTLEHLNGDGQRHREEVGKSTYAQLKDLKRRGWPKDAYTILCWNCNMAKKGGKACPHTLKAQFVVVG